MIGTVYIDIYYSMTTKKILFISCEVESYANQKD